MALRTAPPAPLPLPPPPPQRRMAKGGWQKQGQRSFLLGMQKRKHRGGIGAKKRRRWQKNLERKKAKAETPILTQTAKAETPILTAKAETPILTDPVLFGGYVVGTIPVLTETGKEWRLTCLRDRKRNGGCLSEDLAKRMRVRRLAQMALKMDVQNWPCKHCLDKRQGGGGEEGMALLTTLPFAWSKAEEELWEAEWAREATNEELMAPIGPYLGPYYLGPYLAALFSIVDCPIFIWSFFCGRPICLLPYFLFLWAHMGPVRASRPTRSSLPRRFQERQVMTFL